MFQGYPPDSTLQFIAFTLVLLVIGIIRFLQPGYLKALFSSLLNLSYVQLMLREGRLRWNATNIVLDLIAILSLTFFIHNVILYAPGINLAFWVIPGIVAAVMAGQLLLGFLLGQVFYTFQYILPFIMNMVVFNRILGVVLMPLNVIGTYSSLFTPKVWFLLIGSILFGFLLLRALRALVQMQQLFQHGILYNFCYICVVELAPLVIIVDHLLGPF